MRKSVLLRIALGALGLGALCASYWTGLGHAVADPIPIQTCNTCSCVNMFIYQAVGANSAGPNAFFKQNNDGSYTQSTQAWAFAGTNNTCDTTNTNPTKTTDQGVYVGVTAKAVCIYPPPPPGQTIWVQCSTDELILPPSPDTKPDVTRYVCAPP
jgi:hypothetical protein